MNAQEYQEQLVISTMTEAALQAQILETAHVLGWRSYHTYDSRRSGPGFPDLVLVRAPRLIFAELKTTRGRVTPFQQFWLDALGAVSDAIYAVCGQRFLEVHVWRPADIVGNTVVEVLR